MKLRRSILAATVLFASFEAAKAGAATLPGFQQTIVYTGLDHPTAVRFSPDGRVFVAEKSGLIKVFRRSRPWRRRSSPTCVTG
jgi:glucose/arabinose dehydrogenase